MSQGMACSAQYSTRTPLRQPRAGGPEERQHRLALDLRARLAAGELDQGGRDVLADDELVATVPALTSGGKRTANGERMPSS